MLATQILQAADSVRIAAVDTRQRVLVVDDHRMISEMISAFLDGQSDLAADGVSSIDCALSLLGSGKQYDLVLLDWHIPGYDGLRGIQAIRNVSPAIPIATLSGMLTNDMRRSILDAGCRGMIPKSAQMRSLTNAVRFMLSGEIYMPAETSSAGPGEDTAIETGLSHREIDVMRRLLLGEQNKVIASELGLTEPTIKTYVKNICNKLGVTNRVMAVLKAQEMGMR